MSTGAKPGFWQRFVWFVGLWIAGVVSIAAVGYIIRLWLI